MTHESTFPIMPMDKMSYIPEGKRQMRKIKELAESIKTKGVINPVVIQLNDGKTSPAMAGMINPKAEYIIRRGRRRFEAGKLAGLEGLPYILVTSKTAEADLDIIENTQREPYTHLELYQQALSLYPEIRKGVPPELIGKVAGSLGISSLEAQRILNIRMMTAEVVAAMAAGEISLSLALLSLQVKDPKQMKPYLSMCINEHPSGRAAASWLSDNWRGGESNCRDLDRCLFDKSACGKCSKKGHADHSLFDDPDPKQKSLCWDPACYDGKTKDLKLAVLAKAKELGLAGASIPKGEVDSYDYTVYGGVKPVDPERCKACKSVVIGEDNNDKINILCPKRCANIKSTRGGSDDGRKQKQPKSDKPVIERPKAEKITYLNEKLNLASRKFMIEYFFTGNGNNKKLRPERQPTDTKRILFFLGMEHTDNPFYHYGMGEATKKKFYQFFSYDELARLPKNIENCGSHLAANDQPGRGPKDIDEDVELLYGIKDFCFGHYAEIIELLGKSAKAVMESLGPWGPEWAKNAKVSAPAKAKKAKK